MIEHYIYFYIKTLLTQYTLSVYSYNYKEEAYVKRKDLIKKLELAGFRFKEHGGNHDTYKRGSDTEQIPRHTEINEITAKKILKKWGLK